MNQQCSSAILHGINQIDSILNSAHRSGIGAFKLSLHGPFAVCARFSISAVSICSATHCGRNGSVAQQSSHEQQLSFSACIKACFSMLGVYMWLCQVHDMNLMSARCRTCIGRVSSAWDVFDKGQMQFFYAICAKCRTRQIAASMGVHVVRSEAGRARQMNAGAQAASGTLQQLLQSILQQLLHLCTQLCLLMHNTWSMLVCSNGVCELD